MFYRIRDHVARAHYRFSVRDVLKTRPLAIRPGALTFCSMVSERDLLMYLVSIKSIYTRIAEGTICIINDGSLTAKAREILDYHLGAPAIVDLSSIDTGGCPRGGCWERLTQLLSLTEKSYVIQVDSDLLARGPLTEVFECYRDNRNFTLGTHMGQAFVTLEHAAAVARNSPSTHIQIVGEQALASLGERTALYVRGCAGFSGFARGHSLRPKAIEFSQRMEKILGNKWHEWGSEQITSNYIVANSDGARVLPISKYANYAPSLRLDGVSLVHFLGTYRFAGGKYVDESRKLIATLP